MTVQSGEGKAQEDLISTHKSLSESVRGCSQALSVVCVARTRDHGHKLEHRRFPLNTRSPSVLCSDGALAQAAQRLWGLLLGDLPELPGRGPGHPALGVPAGAQSGAEPLTGSCQPQLAEENK